MVKNKVIGLSVALTLATLMVGCANVTTGQLHAPLEVMPTEVCIIRNPQVTIDAAIPSLQSAFQRRGIKTAVVDDVGACSSEYRLSHAAFLGRNDLSRTGGADALQKQCHCFDG